MGLGRVLLIALGALAGFGREIRVASRTAVESVRAMVQPARAVAGRIAGSITGRSYRVTASKRRKPKPLARRGKHKARLHGRHQRRRGSGRTARRIKVKARRHG